MIVFQALELDNSEGTLQAAAIGGGQLIMLILSLDEWDSIARSNAIIFEENGGVYYNNIEKVKALKIQVEELKRFVITKNMDYFKKEFECEKYWPSVGSTQMYGDIQVVCESEEEFAEFSRRKFTVTKSHADIDSLAIHIVARQRRSRGRYINHRIQAECPSCSGETRRTHNRALQLLNVPGCVLNLRQKRPNMVQTVYRNKRTLTVEHRANQPNEALSLTYLEFTDWNTEERIPNSPANFRRFIAEVDAVTANSSDRPVLIHCLDGASNCGLFCVVATLLQKIEVEHEVSVANAVRKVKTRRKGAIPNLFLNH
ncbi:hypothetical protein DPMN_147804 [Dreissena polymorpha]|uniref:Uncharacterized protein n=1 Tax=Dreissena polymorpha TaxID=45954 RepID=A0A9D4F8X1_DREPO|nr:hypothetical protein DPMN_147804 [Dreissena polymorpha]